MDIGDNHIMTILFCGFRRLLIHSFNTAASDEESHKKKQTKKCGFFQSYPVKEENAPNDKFETFIKSNK